MNTNTCNFFLYTRNKDTLTKVGTVNSTNYKETLTELELSNQEVILCPSVPAITYLNYVIAKVKHYLMTENITLEDATKKALKVVYTEHKPEVDIFLEWAIDTKNVEYYIILKAIQEKL